MRPAFNAHDLWPRLRRFAAGGAWFFIVVSVAHLAWVITTKVGDPSGLTTLYQTSVDGEVYRAWGLAYDGWVGLVQAALQALVVSAAAALTVTPWARGRRIGHGVLVVWSGWWALNLSRLAMLDQEFLTYLTAGFLFMLFGCTIVRAISGWPRSPKPAPEEGGQRWRRALTDARRTVAGWWSQIRPRLDSARRSLLSRAGG